MIREGIFDWENDVIYISQMERCSLTIESMREGLRRGWIPERIPVCQEDDGALIPLEGNHRVSACYAERCNLEYTVELECGILYRGYNINDEIVGSINYERLMNSLIYLPRDVAKQFCDKHHTSENKLEDFFIALTHESKLLRTLCCKW